MGKSMSVAFRSAKEPDCGKISQDGAAFAERKATIVYSPILNSCRLLYVLPGT